MNSHLRRCLWHFASRSIVLFAIVLVVVTVFASSLVLSLYEEQSIAQRAVEALALSQRADAESDVRSGGRSNLQRYESLDQLLENLSSTVAAGRAIDVVSRSAWLDPGNSLRHEIDLTYAGAFSDLVQKLAQMTAQHYSSLSVESIAVQRPSPQTSTVEAKVRLTLVTAP